MKLHIPAVHSCSHIDCCSGVTFNPSQSAMGMTQKNCQRWKTDICRFGDASAIPTFTTPVFALNSTDSACEVWFSVTSRVGGWRWAIYYNPRFSRHLTGDQNNLTRIARLSIRCRNRFGVTGYLIVTMRHCNLIIPRPAELVLR